MTTKAELEAYDAEQRAYVLRLCAWMGLDPAKLLTIEDVDVPVTDPSPIAMPPGVDVTWTTINERVPPAEHAGQYPLPPRMEYDGEVSRFRDGVHLDWSEVDRLRSEVGERPQFPAPVGGWPAHWPAS